MRGPGQGAAAPFEQKMWPFGANFILLFRETSLKFWTKIFSPPTEIVQYTLMWSVEAKNHLTASNTNL